MRWWDRVCLMRKHGIISRPHLPTEYLSAAKWSIQLICLLLVCVWIYYPFLFVRLDTSFGPTSSSTREQQQYTKVICHLVLASCCRDNAPFCLARLFLLFLSSRLTCISFECNKWRKVLGRVTCLAFAFVTRDWDREKRPPTSFFSLSSSLSLRLPVEALRKR